MSQTILKNDSLILSDEKGNKLLVLVKDEVQKIRGLGVYNTSELVDMNYYEYITIGNRRFLILEPSINDKVTTIERKAQIILPKDGMFIIHYCDIKSGDLVIEGGVGSGALSILIANSVMPTGKLISYEKRDEFAKVAQKNILKAGLSEFVEIKKGDLTEEIIEKNVNAVVIDIPNPWDAIDNAWQALKLGGHLACYSPTVNQVEKTVLEMKRYGFKEIKTMETIQREMVVGEMGVRPSFDCLGHTGYITIGRKLE